MMRSILILIKLNYRFNSNVGYLILSIIVNDNYDDNVYYNMNNNNHNNIVNNNNNYGNIYI